MKSMVFMHYDHCQVIQKGLYSFCNLQRIDLIFYFLVKLLVVDLEKCALDHVLTFIFKKRVVLVLEKQQGCFDDFLQLTFLLRI